MFEIFVYYVFQVFINHPENILIGAVILFIAFLLHSIFHPVFYKAENKDKIIKWG